MKQEIIRGPSATGELPRARTRLVIVLAVLAIGAGLLLGLAREALADYAFTCSSTTLCGRNFPRDTDESVPESEGAPDTGHYDRKLGETYWYSVSGGTYTGTTIFDYIKYDWVEMGNCNAAPDRYDRLRAHERAHSRGWAHNEGDRYVNPAYDYQLPGVYCPY